MEANSACSEDYITVNGVCCDLSVVLTCNDAIKNSIHFRRFVVSMKWQQNKRNN